MHADRQVLFLRDAPEGRERFVVEGEPAEPFRSDRDAAKPESRELLRFRDRELRALERNQADGMKTSRIAAAEVSDPAIVRATGRGRDVGIGDVAEEEIERREEARLVDALFGHDAEPCLRVVTPR